MTARGERAAPDAWWLATRAAPAAWVHINEVQGALDDIDAAVAEEDWGTCVEACATAMSAILYCRLVLDGLGARCYDGELELHAAVDDCDAANQLRALPTSYRADRSAAMRARAVAQRAAEALERDLPVDIPVIRTAEGFFPSVRVGADLERFRKRLGLPPIDWISWLR